MKELEYLRHAEQYIADHGDVEQFQDDYAYCRETHGIKDSVHWALWQQNLDMSFANYLDYSVQ